MNIKAKVLPVVLTSYDLLKTFAVLTMIVDHVGYYFFPEEMWWRAFGRMSAPVWLFLVGYALSRDFSLKLWMSAAVLVIISGLLGYSPIPLNILVTIIFLRWIQDYVAHTALRTVTGFCVITLLIAILDIPMMLVVDYGAVSLSIVLFGIAMRRAHDQKIQFDGAPIMVGVTGWLLYNIAMNISFPFVSEQRYSVLFGTAAVFVILYLFKPAVYTRISLEIPTLFTAIIQFCGRRTLEIFVVHIVLFQILAVYLDL